jgi:hypothetical protein
MDTEVKIKRKRDDADDGDQDLHLENVEELKINTEMQKNKIIWADVDNSDEEDPRWGTHSVGVM